MFTLGRVMKARYDPVHWILTNIVVQTVSSSSLYSHNTRPKMPYMLISTQVRLESGPTIVGDSKSDPALMELLGAKRIQQLGNNFIEYVTPDVPRVVLDKLDQQGWKVVAMAGTGQTCCWTLHRPEFKKTD